MASLKTSEFSENLHFPGCSYVNKNEISVPRCKNRYKGCKYIFLSKLFARNPLPRLLYSEEHLVF